MKVKNKPIKSRQWEIYFLEKAPNKFTLGNAVQKFSLYKQTINLLYPKNGLNVCVPLKPLKNGA